MIPSLYHTLTYCVHSLGLFVHYVAKDGFTDMLQNGCSLRIEQY